MNGSVLALTIFAQLAVLAAGVKFLQSANLPGLGRLGSATALAILMAMGALAAVIFVIAEPPFFSTDFRKAYHPAAVAVLQGPSYLSEVITGIHGFVNLPSVAYIFAPFGLLPFKWSRIPFFILGVVATLWTWRILTREARLNERESFVLLLLFALSGPLVNSFKEGNTSHFMLFGLAVALAMIRMGRHYQAGAVLGLCALIKLPLLIFGPYFLLRRNWPAMFAFGGVLLAAAALSLLIFGWDVHVRWFEVCVLQFSRNPIGAFNSQSFPSVLLRLDGGEALLGDWSGHPVEPMQRHLATLIILAMLAIAVVVGARLPQLKSHPPLPSDDERLPLEFALVTTLAVVSSPMSWTHYYCWLLLPAAFALNPLSVIQSNSTTRYLSWVAIFLATPAVLRATFESPLAGEIYAKALVSHYLLAGLIWFGVLVWALARLSRQSATRTASALS